MDLAEQRFEIVVRRDEDGNVDVVRSAPANDGALATYVAEVVRQQADEGYTYLGVRLEGTEGIISIEMAQRMQHEAQHAAAQGIDEEGIARSTYLELRRLGEVALSNPRPALVKRLRADAKADDIDATQDTVIEEDGTRVVTITLLNAAGRRYAPDRNKPPAPTPPEGAPPTGGRG